MKIIIHIGMHKTGSTAIQNHFGKTRYDGVAYCPWTTTNHCGLFMLLFQDDDQLPNYHGFKARGEEFLATLPALKAEWMNRLGNFLETTTQEVVLFSAEDSSWPGFHSAARRMIEFFRNYTTDITVVGYVRPPHSFAVSAFQQYLKDGGMRDLNVEALWPFYEGRFRHFDELLGSENVILRIYRRSDLTGGDIVTDFGKLLNLDVATSFDGDANETLSAEAVSLLFAQRHLGDGYVAGFPSAQVENNQFLTVLSTVGSEKLSFSQELWGPIEQAHGADMAWINDRLQTDLRKDDSGSGLVISSKEDLLAMASIYYPLLKDAFCKALFPVKEPSINKVAQNLDSLRKSLIKVD